MKVAGVIEAMSPILHGKKTSSGGPMILQDLLTLFILKDKGSRLVEQSFE